MKRFIFNQSIDQEIIEKFITLVESAEEDHITIYLTSNGGSEAGMYVLLDIINSTPERFTIYAIEKIFSSAFELFFYAKCARKLAPATIGLCHLSGCDMRILSTGKPYYDTDRETVTAGKVREKGLKVLMDDIGVSSKDQKKVFKGDDVYFQYEDIKKMLETQLSRLQHPAKEGITHISKVV